MNRTTANLILLSIAMIWGLAFVFQKNAMEHVGPFQFVALRGLIAALALSPLAWWELQKKGLPKAEWRGFAFITLITGLVFFAGGSLQQAGLVTATVTNAGFLTGLYVVITPILGWMIFSRLPDTHVVFAILLAFVGLWLLGGGTLGGFSHGDWLVALSALFWAAHLLGTERGAKYQHPITFTTLQFYLIFILGLAATLSFETISLAATFKVWPDLLYVGLLSSALTFTILSWALKYTPAHDAAIIISLETIFAALAGAWLLNEELSPLGWAGAIILFAAMLIVQLYPSTKNKKRSAEA